MAKHSKISRRVLYGFWAGLYVLTVVLGFAFPDAEGGVLVALRLLTVLFFLPPWWILHRAGADGQTKDRVIVRNLSIASLVATTVLVIASILSVGWGSYAVGDALNAVLVVVSAPMVCSNYYALSLFGWATLLAGSLSKKA